MIVRPHICLRCQLHLTERFPLSRYQIAHQSTTAKVIIPRYTKDDETESTYYTKRLWVQPDDDVEFPAVHRRTSVVRNGPVTRTPLGKLYGYLGSMQRANRESLGDIHTLGDPAEVIVLRDSKIMAYAGGLREIEALEPEPVDILATLDNERGLVGQREVEENINHLRPKEGEEPENLAGFDDLVQQLQAGFTVSQLARYIQSYQKDKPEEVLQKSTEGSPILRISAWVPKTASFGKLGDTESTRGYSFASYTSKQRLALRLIRECWKLELPQLEEGIGEVELQLQPGDFELLMSRSTSVLRLIMNKYITTQEESIQGSKDGRALFLTTTRDKCRLVVEEIEQALAKVRKVEIPIRSLTLESLRKAPLRRQWMDTNLDDTTLKRLGDLTNTTIHRNKSTVSISCIDQNQDNLTSSRAEAALRLLLKAIDIPDRTTNWLGCKDVTHANNGMLLPSPADYGFSWHNRLRSWNRWTMPAQKKQKKTDSSKKEPAEAIVEDQPIITSASPVSQKIILVETKPSKTNRDASSVYWTSDYVTESSALFGSVLHSLRDDSINPRKLRPADLLTNAHQFFSTKVENISHIFGSNTVRTVRGEPARSIVLRFMPNPFYIPGGMIRQVPRPVGAQAMTAFPRVEMRLVVDPQSKELKLRDVQAIVSTHNTDLMLPDYSVDVRLQQNIRSQLRGRQGPSQFPPEIVEFVKNSNLNLDFANGKLETPPKLMIPIASHLCLAPGFGMLDQAASDAPLQNVEYLFAGLEICNSMKLEFDGWNLQYTSIEAGRASGRRGELRLRPSRRTIFGKANEEEFMKSTMRMAEALDTGKVPDELISTARRAKGQGKAKIADSTSRVPKFKGHGRVRDAKSKFFAKRVEFRVNEGQKKNKEIDAFWGLLEGEEDEDIEDGHVHADIPNV